MNRVILSLFLFALFSASMLLAEYAQDRALSVLYGTALGSAFLVNLYKIGKGDE